jgi:hypothetical protein
LQTRDAWPRSHIACENEDFVPTLETLLAADQRLDIGQGVALLRGAAASY